MEEREIIELLVPELAPAWCFGMTVTNYLSPYFVIKLYPVVST